MDALQLNSPRTQRNGVGIEPPPSKLQSIGKILGATLYVLALSQAIDKHKPRHSLDTLILNIILVAGWCFVGLQWIQYRSDKLHRKAYRRMESTPSNLESIPSIASRYWIKTPKRQFTHTHEFAIKDRSVWSRCHTNIEESWKRIPFPGMVHGATPQEIRADGANLMIRGSDGRIYYKKVIAEDVNNNVYGWIDLTVKYNWSQIWFTLPVISKVAKILYTIPGAPSGLLTIPDGVKSWSISHLGRYARYYDDEAGNRHKVSSVTQVLAIFDGSNDLYWADPHIPGGFNHPANITGLGIDHRLPGPDCEGFVADHIDSSGSLIVMSGKVGNVWKAFTCFTDFDIRGRNPTHRVTQDIQIAARDKIRYAMPVIWKPVEPLPEGAEPTGALQVEQTGEGNSNRMLAIPAKNPENESGHYLKELNETEWHFIAHPSP